jgi:hypothetical protein
MDFFCLYWRGIVNALGSKPEGKRLPGGFSKPHGERLKCVMLEIRVSIIGAVIRMVKIRGIFPRLHSIIARGFTWERGNSQIHNASVATGLL